jgi:Uma2 family endonuclease
MAARTIPRATYEDLVALPENVVGEILDGTLVTNPRPASAHAQASSALGGELFTRFGRHRGGPGGWVILDEPELHLASDVLVPDIAGWRRERMPKRPATAAFVLAPDWVCEVLSDSTRKVDRADKLPIYAREGVTHAWLVDPAARTLEVFRREGAHWLLLATHHGDALVHAEPFDAVELDLSDLWAE